jgi:hypothetical protein
LYYMILIAMVASNGKTVPIIGLAEASEDGDFDASFPVGPDRGRDSPAPTTGTPSCRDFRRLEGTDLSCEQFRHVSPTASIRRRYRGVE